MAGSRSLGGILILFTVALGISPAAAQPPAKQTIITKSYDLHDVLAKPVSVAPFGGAVAPPWNAFKENAQQRSIGITEKSTRLVQAIVTLVDGVAGERTA